MLHNLWLLLIASLLKEIGHLRIVFYEMGSIVWKQNEVLFDNVIYSVFKTNWSIKHIALGFMGDCIGPQGGCGGDHCMSPGIQTIFFVLCAHGTSVCKKGLPWRIK